MAYMDFNSGFAAAQRMSVPCPSGLARDALTPLEWQVVAMARRDSMSSLGAPGVFERLFARLFGARPSAVLADGRLEALRRLAVSMWHKGAALPVSEVKAAKAAGFNGEQVEALLGAIGRARIARPLRG